MVRGRSMTVDTFFRVLTPTEIARFTQWAYTNYTANEPINPLWHPVIRAACMLINAPQPPSLCRDCGEATDRGLAYHTGCCPHAVVDDTDGADNGSDFHWA